MQEDVLVVIGEKINELRTKRNVTQKELADYLGVGQTMVAYWEVGAREIKATTVHKICEYFQVSPNLLMGYDDVIFSTKNLVIRVSDKEAEILNKFLKDKQFMKCMEENTEDRIERLIKLMNSINRIFLS